MGPLVLASQVATGLAFGAALVKFAFDNSNPFDDGGRSAKCARCNGTGRVACMCKRWSDGDFGCRTCAGSGRMACSSCGGTGTGRPIPVQIRVQPSGPPPPR